MIDKSQHIVIKSIIMLLLVVIVLPHVVKFAHVLEDHNHKVCDTPSDTHYHEIDIDCEFYKFKLNNTFTVVFNDYSILYKQVNYKLFYCNYTFLKSFKNFGIALRGPPKNPSSSC